MLRLHVCGHGRRITIGGYKYDLDLLLFLVQALVHLPKSSDEGNTIGTPRTAEQNSGGDGRCRGGRTISIDERCVGEEAHHDLLALEAWKK